ncbi:hypothetical protein C1H46_018301 [Malus baccata]|uniref:Uncharacterized protein n=1 Tax=Malus baccata TaxID=106549 RepID=A0A540MBF0_MALBA|nr:hypothetical protein C1H46_018301 [Malus baccata]
MMKVFESSESQDEGDGDGALSTKVLPYVAGGTFWKQESKNKSGAVLILKDWKCPNGIGVWMIRRSLLTLRNEARQIWVVHEVSKRSRCIDNFLSDD